MDPVAQRLAELLNKEVSKVDDCIGPEVEEAVNNMQDGDVLVLENTRFYKEETKNDPDFAKNWPVLLMYSSVMPLVLYIGPMPLL